MKIYRFNTVLAAAVLLLFAGQVMVSSAKRGVSDEEWAAMAKQREQRLEKEAFDRLTPYQQAYFEKQRNMTPEERAQIKKEEAAMIAKDDKAFWAEHKRKADERKAEKKKLKELEQIKKQKELEYEKLKKEREAMLGRYTPIDAEILD